MRDPEFDRDDPAPGSPLDFLDEEAPARSRAHQDRWSAAGSSPTMPIIREPVPISKSGPLRPPMPSNRADGDSGRADGVGRRGSPHGTSRVSGRRSAANGAVRPSWTRPILFVVALVLLGGGALLTGWSYLPFGGGLGPLADALSGGAGSPPVAEDRVTEAPIAVAPVAEALAEAPAEAPVAETPVVRIDPPASVPERGLGTRFRDKLAEVEQLVEQRRLDEAERAIESMDRAVYGYGFAEFSALRDQVAALREGAEPESVAEAATGRRDTDEAAEAERRAEAEWAAETERRAETQRAAEAERLAEAERAAEAERLAEAERAAEAERLAEAERAAEAERRAEAERTAEAERLVEAERAAEAERRAEAERAAEAERLAEAERAAEAERRAEAERAAEAERLAGAERAAEAERRAEAERAAEAERLAEAELEAEAERLSEAERAAEAVRIAEVERSAVERRVARAERAAMERRVAEAREAVRATTAVTAAPVGSATSAARQRAADARATTIVADRRATDRRIAEQRAAEARRQAAEAVPVEETAPIVVARRAIDDEDVQIVYSRLQAFRKALEERDIERVMALSNPSSARIQQLLQVFANSEAISTRIANVSTSTVDDSITGTLRIEAIRRTDGTRVRPPANLESLALTSTRSGTDWSMLSW